MIALAGIFFFIAFFYSMVGFGGGTLYLAVLTLSELPYALIPPVARMCNIIVSSSAVYHYSRQGHFSFNLLWPFVVTSVPFAYLGGILRVSQQYFYFIVAITLLIASLRMLWGKKEGRQGDSSSPNLRIAMLSGSILGLISGIAGVGGGIFLVPILYHFRWGTPKQIAVVAACFVLVNSSAGLSGHIQKLQNINYLVSYWPLFLAVLVGGQVGSFLGSGKIRGEGIRAITAVLILIAGVKLLIKAFMAH